MFVDESVLGIIFYKIIPAPSDIVGGHDDETKTHLYQPISPPD